jgi:hypothetical protein
VAVSDLDQRLRVRLHASGGLGVHECGHARVAVLFERVLKLVGVNRLTPFVLDHDRRGAATLDVFDHASTEDPVSAHDHLVARRDHVDEAVLHADRAGARDREGERVLRLVNVAQQRLQLLHHLDEHRIEVADRGLAHRGEDARMDLGRAGAHERPLRRVKRADAFGGREFVHEVLPC